MCPLDMVSPELNYVFWRKITPSSGLKEMNAHMSRKNRESRVPTTKLSSRHTKLIPIAGHIVRAECLLCAAPE